MPKRKRGDHLASEAGGEAPDAAAVVAIASALREHLKGATTVGVEELRALVARLERWPVRVAVLKRSEVAKAVKALREHSDEPLASAARRLFAR